MNSIKQNGEQIAEIANRIALERGVDINEIDNLDLLNKIFSEAIKEFDELQRELERSGLQIEIEINYRFMTNELLGDEI